MSLVGVASSVLCFGTCHIYNVRVPGSGAHDAPRYGGNMYCIQHVTLLTIFFSLELFPPGICTSPSCVHSSSRAPVHYVVDAVASTGLYTMWWMSWRASAHYQRVRAI
jgi:hypothetical protein